MSDGNRLASVILARSGDRHLHGLRQQRRTIMEPTIAKVERELIDLECSLDTKKT